MLASGFNVIRYAELDSTNSEAWRLIDHLDRPEADHTDQHQTVIIAKRQTKGRGQRGHQWQSDLGGLFMSVILRIDLAAIDAHQITLWSAWGIAKKLQEVGANVRLKWLNDLLIERRKVGGILTETRIEAGQIHYAVVGIGLNWTNDVPEGAIAIGELPTTLSSMDELIDVVLEGIALGQNRSNREGMDGILAEYLQMLCDRNIRKIVNGRELHGQIIDIRATGELVVIWEGDCQQTVYQPQAFSVGY